VKLGPEDGKRGRIEFQNRLERLDRTEVVCRGRLHRVQ
jgi:hypothetical protein